MNTLISETQKAKILIVDDKPENILALERLLDDEDTEAISATNAHDALGLLLTHEFALAMIDVQMPIVSGFELAKLMRGAQRSRHIPIIFVTAAQARSDSIFEGYEKGAVDFLFKHLDPNIVRSKVRVFIELDRQKKVLRVLKEEADASNVAKSRFLANMSHEIRTPLSAVLGFADLLSAGGLSESDQRSYVDSISRNGKVLAKLIDDVLDLSKIEADKIEIETVPINVLDLCYELHTTLGYRAKEKGVELELCSKGMVPERFFSDLVRVRQILTNLVGNAIKFTDSGKIAVEISFEPKNSGTLQKTDQLRFQVKDSGCGLNSNAKARIFQPFTQGDSSTSRKHGGTGLGLTISRELARALGGDLILAETQEGQSSTFVATISPGNIQESRMIEISSVSRSEIPPNPVTDVTPDLRDLNILIVDDAPDNLLLMSRILANAGAKFRCVDNGPDCLSAANSDDYDVVITDIQMPIMDGYEVTRRLRRAGFEKPIIALTAHAMKEDLKKCLECGCDDYLSKPLNRKLLLKKLRELKVQTT